MRVSCSSITFEALMKARLMTLSDLFKLVKDFDIDAVELQYEHIPSLSQSYIDTLLKEAQREEVSIVALSVNNRFGFPEETKREMELERIRRAMSIAVALGARVIKLSAGESHPSDADYDRCKSWVVDAFLKIAEMAERMELPVAVKNEEGVCAHPEELLWLIDEVNSPYLGICLDALNLIQCGLSGDSVYEAVELLAPFAMHSHARFSNFNEAGDDMLLDYERLMRIFAGAEYEGFHSIVDPSDNPLERLPIAVTLLRRSIQMALSSPHR
ncbi:MAG: sugar phosphate isomerase/epimerase family protein [Armatimonadota bacterium]|nr:sugar phosphate isomerase/epimerase [Armatimonadota bacterium]MDW8025307.1 sugar phosphate isomerase/epimerase family protein [Armatimonadota bacterium]